jgi:hypothetical protein
VRYVALKTPAQLDLQALHRVRERQLSSAPPSQGRAAARHATRASPGGYASGGAGAHRECASPPPLEERHAGALGQPLEAPLH